MADDKKPADESLQLIIRLNGAETKLKVKAGTKFSKVFSAFFKSKSIDTPASWKFVYEGTKIEDDQTPMGLDMEDGAMIDCMQAQTGGGVW
jgi:small ubiquitin-related modifier